MSIQLHENDWQCSWKPGTVARTLLLSLIFCNFLWRPDTRTRTPALFSGTMMYSLATTMELWRSLEFWHSLWKPGTVSGTLALVLEPWHSLCHPFWNRCTLSGTLALSLEPWHPMLHSESDTLSLWPSLTVSPWNSDTLSALGHLGSKER